MNPLVDEKMILITSSAATEVIGEGLEIECFREAYGPTINEGLCFESCVEFKFKGSINGKFFLGLDGYTKILLLPYLAKKILPQEGGEFDDVSRQRSTRAPEQAKGDKNFNQTLIVILAEKFGEMVVSEMEEFIDDFFIKSINPCDHKLISLSGKDYRKYTSIFFLKDEQIKKYLGRLYIIVAVEKE